MKKKQLIALGVTLFVLAACNNPFFPEKRDLGGDTEVPVISAQPQSAVYTTGVQAVALTVSASVGDGGTLSYQWYGNEQDSNKGGTAIHGETETSYTPPTDEPGIVYYHVVVTNTLNGKKATAASHTAKIEVNGNVNAAVPHVAVHPLSAEYILHFGGEALTVSASVSDGGTLSYQWYSNAHNSNEGGTEIDGENGTSYTPPSDQLGTVYYYVVVTNTIADNGDGGNKNAVEASDTVSVTVDLVRTIWARTVSASAGITSWSGFNAVAVDAFGNVYAAGLQNGTCTYGSGVTAAGTSSNGNVVLVKYDSTGNAQWARTVSAGSDRSQFDAVAVDASGNVYAAGYQSGTGAFTYGSGVTATGTSSDYNMVLVKYDSGGTAQWARTVSAGSDRSQFDAVAVDASGNVYAAGYQNSGDVVLVKYDSGGTTQWARTVSAGNSYSEFYAVAVDASGNVYAAGSQGSGTLTYGSGVSVDAIGNRDVVLVKYDSSGTAQWARTVSGVGSTGWSFFNALAVDASGNVYAAGSQNGTGAYTYGSGVSASGTNSGNVVLVKYNSNGAAQWARTVSAGSATSQFYAVAVDASGVYAAGYQFGTGAYTYGSGVTATGTYSSENVVLVKYDSSGTAQWARTVSAGSNLSRFYAVAVDASRNVYAAGYQEGTDAYTYGSGVSATGTGLTNVVLVKYRN